MIISVFKIRVLWRASAVLCPRTHCCISEPNSTRCVSLSEALWRSSFNERNLDATWTLDRGSSCFRILGSNASCHCWRLSQVTLIQQQLQVNVPISTSTRARDRVGPFTSSVTPHAYGSLTLRQCRCHCQCRCQCVNETQPSRMSSLSQMEVDYGDG